MKGHEHAQATYAFFHKNFGWHSFDDQGSELEVHLHAALYDDNAWWDTSCSSMFASPDRVSRDTVAHELIHGVINTTSELVYGRQPGALNESYADVMGTFADQDWEKGQGLPIDWLQGEDMMNGAGPSRDLSNPTNPNVGYPQRDHMDSLIPFGTDEVPTSENDYR